MQITATHIAYYHICHCKLWLFSNGINMEHTSERVAEGKLIGDTSYAQRSGRYTEIEMGGSKIDFYDPKEKVIHEVKKSDKMEDAHIWQVKWYMLLLQRHGIEGVIARIEYPRLRHVREVKLEQYDEMHLDEACRGIARIVNGECPKRIKSGICKKCAYYEFCYIDT